MAIVESAKHLALRNTSHFQLLSLQSIRFPWVNSAGQLITCRISMSTDQIPFNDPDRGAAYNFKGTGIHRGTFFNGTLYVAQGRPVLDFEMIGLSNQTFVGSSCGAEVTLGAQKVTLDAILREIQMRTRKGDIVLTIPVPEDRKKIQLYVPSSEYPQPTLS